jgi:hypothetical protein
VSPAPGSILVVGSLFCWYGNSAYSGQYHCIRMKHKEGYGLAPLTLRQLQENKAMKKIRITIEWSYGQNTVLWKEADNWVSRKMDLNAEMVCSSIGVKHLFTNIYVCFHQYNISNSFKLSPPTLEEYLGKVGRYI